jgi:hypothetical protein
MGSTVTGEGGGAAMWLCCLALAGRQQQQQQQQQVQPKHVAKLSTGAAAGALLHQHIGSQPAECCLTLKEATGSSAVLAWASGTLLMAVIITTTSCCSCSQGTWSAPVCVPAGLPGQGVAP